MLSVPQGQITLYNALKGYSAILRESDEDYAITPKMIGFGDGGKTKVWIHENFGMNHSALEKGVEKKEKKDKKDKEEKKEKKSTRRRDQASQMHDNIQ